MANGEAKRLVPAWQGFCQRVKGSAGRVTLVVLGVLAGLVAIAVMAALLVELLLSGGR